MIKVAINGFGRIGRLCFRLMEENEEFEVVAVNDLTDAEQLAYLLKYDTIHHSMFEDEIEISDEGIYVNGKFTRVLQIDDPKDYPWRELNVDLVLDCTGAFTKDSDAVKHIE